jgi:hypothetical protein
MYSVLCLPARRTGHSASDPQLGFAPVSIPAVLAMGIEWPRNLGGHAIGTFGSHSQRRRPC